MPELPEVEVTRLSLVDRIGGARIENVRLGKPLRWPLGCEPEGLVGRRIETVTRRGKYLWFALQRAGTSGAAPSPSADDADGLLIHLGMSGSLNLAPQAGPPGPWDHFDLGTDRGTLRLTDPRRFGAVVWSATPSEGMAGKLLSSLGVEPFDAAFDARMLRESLRHRRVPIKQALLAGDIVVGVGNIYASEALFLAGIDPRTESRRVGPLRCARLVDAVRQVLTQALALGGSTLRDFRDAHGAGGAFQKEARVYGREGQACTRCGGVIRRIVQGQRSTFFCAGCQQR